MALAWRGQKSVGVRPFVIWPGSQFGLVLPCACACAWPGRLLLLGARCLDWGALGTGVNRGVPDGGRWEAGGGRRERLTRVSGHWPGSEKGLGRRERRHLVGR
jgi:hypothetical protein